MSDYSVHEPIEITSKSGYSLSEKSWSVICDFWFISCYILSYLFSFYQKIVPKFLQNDSVRPGGSDTLPLSQKNQEKKKFSENFPRTKFLFEGSFVKKVQCQRFDEVFEAKVSF